MFTSTFNISSKAVPWVPIRSDCFFHCVDAKIGENLCLHFFFLLQSRNFSGSVQVLLIILVLWCPIKHDGKDAQQECWGGRNVAQHYPGTISFPNRSRSEVLPGLHCKFMLSAECRRSCFAYYLSAPGDSTIDHWFVVCNRMSHASKNKRSQSCRKLYFKAPLNDWGRKTVFRCRGQTYKQPRISFSAHVNKCL